MQEFWVPRTQIDPLKWPNPTDHYFLIYLPNNCIKCSHPVDILHKGDANSSGLLNNICNHYLTYDALFNNQIQCTPINQTVSINQTNAAIPVHQTISINSIPAPPVSTTINTPVPYFFNVSFQMPKSMKNLKINDPTQDGMKCSGSCGSWNPMAEANRDDGTFICYSCRNGF